MLSVSILLILYSMSILYQDKNQRIKKEFKNTICVGIKVRSKKTANI